MCLVVFSQIFWKIFSSVWKKRRKRQIQKSTNKTQIDAWRLTGFDGAVLCKFQSDDHVVDRDLAKHRAASQDRDWREGEIMIDDAISRNDALIAIGAKTRSRSKARRRDRDQRREITISDHDRRRWCLRTERTGARWVRSSLSLSLSLRNSFEVKIGTKIHFRSQSLFFWVNGNQFSENSIFWTNQIPAFLEKHFKKWFSPKTNTALEEWYCSPTFKKMTFFPLKFWRKSI